MGWFSRKSRMVAVAAVVMMVASASPTRGVLLQQPQKQQRLFVLGGSLPNEPPVGKVSVFEDDEKNGSWAQVKAMGSIGPCADRSGRAAAVDGALYYIGGQNEEDYPYVNSTLRYDAKEDSWVRLAGIPFPVTDPEAAPDGSGVADHAVVGLKGYLYVVGGTNGTASLASTWRYDPAANTWAQMSSMHFPRCYVAAAAVGGKIYAVGGSLTPAGPGGPGGGPGALSSVEVYDPEMDTWAVLTAKMNVARSVLAVAAVGDRYLYAVGGEDGGRTSKSFATVERLDTIPDPGTVTGISNSSNSSNSGGGGGGEWTMVASMHRERCQLGVGVLNGALFAVGGYNEKSRSDFGWLHSVEKYDAATDSWRFVSPFPHKQHYLATAVLELLPLEVLI